jgi:ribonucleoside-diphosphate reductase alpha chain
VLSGGAGQAPVTAALAGTAAGAVIAATAAIGAAGAVAMDRRAEARMKGYEGDACGECGNFTLVRNGTCLKCDSCGGTSGCS